jgi:hypothetical protein
MVCLSHSLPGQMRQYALPSLVSEVIEQTWHLFRTENAGFLKVVPLTSPGLRKLRVISVLFGPAKLTTT